MWETGLFECCQVKDAGPFCCVQHCCCQPCVVASAMKNAGLKDSDLVCIGLTLGGERSALDEVAGYIARRKVVDKYKIDETEGRSCAYATCCMACSNVQIVNTLMTREDLVYECAATRRTTPLPPRPRRMRR